MGTYYSSQWRTRADVVKHITSMGHVVEHAERVEGEEYVLWTAERSRNEEGEVTQTIGCYLLRCYDGQWGYKPMSEEMQPYFTSVPRHWLKKYPVRLPKAFQHCLPACEEWRAGVKASPLRREDESGALVADELLQD